MTAIRPDLAGLDEVCGVIARIVDVTPVLPRRIRVRTGTATVEIEWPAGDPGLGIAPAAAVAPAVETLHEVPAPLVGTFHRCPKPGAAAFVEVGDRVSVGQQLAIVEAMKLMNPMEADIEGRVLEILVGNGESVEYGEPLFRIEPTDSR